MDQLYGLELFPELTGDELTVQFVRPGSEPEVVERELLLPLAARVSGLPQVAESWGEVRGARGQLRVRFERGADLKVRQLDLQRLATTLVRSQPPGTFVDVQAQDTSVLSRAAPRMKSACCSRTCSGVVSAVAPGAM